MFSESSEGIPLHAILAIQASSLLARQSSPSTSGFLMAQWLEIDVHALLARGSTLLCAMDGQTLSGYALVADAEYLSRQSPTYLAQGIAEKDLYSLRHIAQLAVAASSRRSGVAGKLIEAARSLNPAGLSADVVVEPIVNSPSLRLFASAGFDHVGRFVFEDCTAMKGHASAVFAWRALRT